MERCISYFDLVDIDIDATIRILLKQELISGFLYVYSYGLLDYSGAFQLIYEQMIMKQNYSTTQEFPSPEQTDIGYKLLLFLQYTSEGRVFPRGEKLKLPSTALVSLARLLLSPAVLPPIAGSTRLETQLEKHPLLLKTFPYMYALSKIDFYALFYCLHLCLIGVYESGTLLSQESNELSYGDLLYSALLFAKYGDTDLGMKSSFQRCFYEHLLDHIVSVTSTLPELFLRDIIYHCRSHIKPYSMAEKYMFTLVSSQNKCNHHSFTTFAMTLENNGFFFPALRLYGGKLKPTSETLNKSLQCYLSERNEEFRMKVFDYIQEFFSKLNLTDNMVGESTDDRVLLCRSVLISYLEELATINLHHTKIIVVSYLNRNITEVMEKTQRHQKLQFELLDALVRGIASTDPEEGTADITESTIFDDMFTPQQILSYITQLATFRPADLHSFLTTHHNYPLDDVLKLCRSKNIFDSTAFLLERAGDFQAALDLCLSEIGVALLQTVVSIENVLDKGSLDVDTKKTTHRRGSRSSQYPSSDELFSILKYSANKHVANGRHTYGLSSSVLDPVNQIEGFKTFSLAISTATGLCTRHDSKSNATHWFKVLDFLLKEKRMSINILFYIHQIHFLPQMLHLVQTLRNPATRWHERSSVSSLAMR